jgi:hypothetical protein
MIAEIVELVLDKYDKQYIVLSTKGSNESNI